MNTFFAKSAFRNNINNEINSAKEVYQPRKADGMKDYSIAAYDFVFTSDAKSKLEDLGAFLSEKYGYSIEEVINGTGGWDMMGNATAETQNSTKAIKKVLSDPMRRYKLHQTHKMGTLIAMFCSPNILVLYQFQS